MARLHGRSQLRKQQETPAWAADLKLTSWSSERENTGWRGAVALSWVVSEGLSEVTPVIVLHVLKSWLSLLLCRLPEVLQPSFSTSLPA